MRKIDGALKAGRFRSPEEWRTALLSLPDASYFELLRGVFGNIKTPFNKQRLMADLSSFLARRDIQDTIQAYLDKEDHRIIAAIGVLDEPGPGDLERFFTGEYTPLELHTMLLNLEERLILYRFLDEGLGKRRLALNPLLEPVLGPLLKDTAPLFSSEAAPPEQEAVVQDTPVPRRLDDRLLAALLAFVSEKGDFFKAEGGIRKKILEEGNLIFPALPWETLIGGLRALGLLDCRGGRLLADDQNLRFFRRLSFRERMEYWAAGIFTHLQGGEERHTHRSRMQALARFIHRFTMAIEGGRRYPLKTLRRLASIAEQEDRGNALSIEASDFERFLEALEIPGFLRPAGPLWWSSGGDLVCPKPTGPVIAMDTPFSCILFPQISCADALILSSFCTTREAATVVRFELTRESVVRGLDRGLTAEEILQNLERLSGEPMNQNLDWTVKDWGTRYAAVSLYQGTVLTLTEDRRYLAQADGLSSLISEVLAPGIYLLSVSDKEQAALALEKAGIDIVAQPEPGRNGETRSRSSPYPSVEFSLPSWNAANDAPVGVPETDAPEGESAPASPGDPTSAETYKSRFRLALEKRSLPKQERDELAARIDRRVILCESQLIGGTVRSEKMEAKNLDYVGKIALAKQAIALKAFVEILAFNGGGELSRIFGIPEGLEKADGETILVVKPLSKTSSPMNAASPDRRESSRREAATESKGPEELLRLPLGKIHLLRRIRQSIFGA